MLLDGVLDETKLRPRKHRQSQVDGGGIERIDHRKPRAGVQRARRVCIGQRVSRNRLTAKIHVVQPPGLRTQVDFDVEQGLPIDELGESYGKELV